ncbi:dromaiocalcin-1-like isoform X4 [Gymnodraco acuticeps]|uniref:Dromaiocalcin-1-like isoform X4 n=1 Tax=Gymnodraco acuticeps TaxID=8218 RepID=A0A6P8T7Z9_GYMAC|nr:dromaiocalcin-1-like isoform X4 [Gymnodraco acuticeps]
MAEGEEEVNYASVVFKAGNNPPPAAKRGEETVYGEVKAQNETKNEDSAGRRRFQHLACCLGILCVILLGGIIGVCVYHDKCKPCQKGWSLTEPSCYAYINAQYPHQKTWEEAQEDCRGRNSDLAVAHDSEEKEAINTNSFGSNGFWIGLRVVNKKWKWVDGSDLTESSWIVPPVDGGCALFYKGRDKWSSVSCGATHEWICQQKALSV